MSTWTAADLARLRTLAQIGACANHEWYFDVTLNIDEIPAGAHVNDGSAEFGFETCPHPDCVLVRDRAVLVARTSFAELLDAAKAVLTCCARMGESPAWTALAEAVAKAEGR